MFKNAKFQGIVSIWSRAYSEIFKSALGYLSNLFFPESIFNKIYQSLRVRRYGEK